MDNIYYIGSGPAGNSSSGGPLGGGLPGGSPGGPGQGGSTLGAIIGGLHQSDTSQSLNSNVSYTSEDLRNSGGAEIQNVKNLLQDKSLTSKEREVEILKAFARLTDDLIEAKREIRRLKQQGNIPLMLDSEKK